MLLVCAHVPLQDGRRQDGARPQHFVPADVESPWAVAVDDGSSGCFLLQERHGGPLVELVVGRTEPVAAHQRHSTAQEQQYICSQVHYTTERTALNTASHNALRLTFYVFDSTKKAFLHTHKKNPRNTFISEITAHHKHDKVM